MIPPSPMARMRYSRVLGAPKFHATGDDLIEIIAGRCGFARGALIARRYFPRRLSELCNELRVAWWGPFGALMSSQLPGRRTCEPVLCETDNGTLMIALLEKISVPTRRLSE